LHWVLLPYKPDKDSATGFVLDLTLAQDITNPIITHPTLVNPLPAMFSSYLYNLHCHAGRKQ
jgi:hypothetical protein